MAVVAVAALSVSWQRWANPIVDCGREMYVPWRILEGDVLYRDLFFVYGPLVPYWHATLFLVFGVHQSPQSARSFIGWKAGMTSKSCA